MNTTVRRSTKSSFTVPPPTPLVVEPRAPEFSEGTLIGKRTKCYQAVKDGEVQELIEYKRRRESRK
jgi:hypothetical protein